MGYTIFIPLIGALFLPDVAWSAVMNSLIHPSIMVLLGPSLIVCMWCRWGLTRRVGLLFLSYVGTSVRTQAIAWLIISTTLSFVAANTVIAIALTPIVVELLNYVGYDTPAKRRNNASCALIIIGVATGATLGGFMTPMAGGQAIIVWNAKESYFEGSQEYYKEELKKMGRISKVEIYSLLWYSLAIILPFARPFYVQYMPIDMPPEKIFTLITGLLLLLPTPDKGPVKGKTTPYQPNKRMLSVNAIKVFPIHAFLLWPIAMSIAEIINEAGTSNLIAGFLGSYWDMPPFVGVGLLVVFCLILSQVASNTGAAAMLAGTVALQTVQAGANPVIWLFILGFTVNFSFCIPAATGSMAIPIALGGKSTYRLPLYGVAITLVCGLVSWLFWSLAILNNWTFWQSVTTI